MNDSPIALLQELLKCGTNIPVWHYDMDGHLLDTNSEHLVLDKILGFIGGTQYMLEFAQKSRNPLVLGSDMGLMWCAVYEAEKGHIKSIYLIGPVFNAEIGEAFLEESANRYQIEPAFRKQFIRISGPPFNKPAALATFKIYFVFLLLINNLVSICKHLTFKLIIFNSLSRLSFL